MLTALMSQAEGKSTVGWFCEMSEGYQSGLFGVHTCRAKCVYRWMNAVGCVSQSLQPRVSFHIFGLLFRAATSYAVRISMSERNVRTVLPCFSRTASRPLPHAVLDQSGAPSREEGLGFARECHSAATTTTQTGLGDFIAAVPSTEIWENWCGVKGSADFQMSSLAEC